MRELISDLFGFNPLLLATIFGSLALTSALLMGSVGKPMKAGGGGGIVDFELAMSKRKADATLDDWGEEGQKAAACSLLLDFPFLVGYGGLLAVACVSVSSALGRRGWEMAADIALWGAVAALGAAALDVIENISLLSYLRGARNGFVIGLASVSAVLKFIVLGVVVIGLCGSAVYLGARTS